MGTVSRLTVDGGTVFDRFGVTHERAGGSDRDSR